MLKNLLEKLNKSHLKQKKLNELSLNSFNIFSILRKPNDEVNLHSKFIFELLNPKGSHQQGDRFLQLFFQELNMEEEKFGYKVFREKFNIDILLTSSNRAVLIENKIDTQDHSNQLSNYYQRIQEEGYGKNNIIFFYLTLFEEEPNEVKMRKKIRNITYQYEVRNWIEACIKEVIKLPILRDTLVQYFKLINQLTEQSQEKGFMMKTKELLLQDNNLELILSIEEAVIDAKIEVQLSFWEHLKKHLEVYYSFTFYSLNGEKTIRKSVHKYYKKRKNRKDFGLEYQVDENLYFFIELRNYLYYGFEFRKEVQPEQAETMSALWVNWEDDYWKYSDKKLNFEQFNNPNVLSLIETHQQEETTNAIANEIISLIRQYKNLQKDAS